MRVGIAGAGAVGLYIADDLRSTGHELGFVQIAVDRGTRPLARPFGHRSEQLVEATEEPAVLRRSHDGGEHRRVALSRGGPARDVAGASSFVRRFKSHRSPSSSHDSMRPSGEKATDDRDAGVMTSGSSRVPSCCTRNSAPS